MTTKTVPKKQTLKEIFEKESINVWNDYLDDDLNNVLKCIRLWLQQSTMTLKKALEELEHE